MQKLRTWKLVSLQCSWEQKLFDHNFYDYEIIELYLIKKNV